MTNNDHADTKIILITALISDVIIILVTNLVFSIL